MLGLGCTCAVITIHTIGVNRCWVTATISQTMRTYSHLMSGMSDVAVTAMESILARNRVSQWGEPFWDDCN